MDDPYVSWIKSFYEERATTEMNDYIKPLQVLNGTCVIPHGYLQPGDVLVLKSNRPLTEIERYRLGQMETELKISILMLDANMSLAAILHTQGEHAPETR